MARTNIYRYFCPIARSLELVGEKWTLPIVLALLLDGPLRFSDLERQLASITPKSLTGRLRELESAGLIERERRSGESRYLLTAAGRDLGPVLNALNRWSVEHAVRPPDPDEPLNPEPIARSIWAYVVTRRPPFDAPRSWELRFGEDRWLTLAFDGSRWSQSSAPADDATLAVHAPLEAWACFLAAGPEERLAAASPFRFTGPDAEIDDFLALFGVLRESNEAGYPIASRERTAAAT